MFGPCPLNLFVRKSAVVISVRRQSAAESTLRTSADVDLKGIPGLRSDLAHIFVSAATGDSGPQHQVGAPQTPTLNGKPVDYFGIPS